MTEIRLPNATWYFSNGAGPDYLGFLLTWFDDTSDVPAQEQANDGYLRTGGCPFSPTPVNFSLKKNDAGEYRLENEGDPPLPELARTKIKDETVVVFDCAFMAIIQPDETFVVARVD